MFGTLATAVRGKLLAALFGALLAPMVSDALAAGTLTTLLDHISTKRCVRLKLQTTPLLPLRYSINTISIDPPCAAHLATFRPQPLVFVHVQQQPLESQSAA